LQKIESGGIIDAKTILLLYYLQTKGDYLAFKKLRLIVGGNSELKDGTAANLSRRCFRVPICIPAVCNRVALYFFGGKCDSFSCEWSNQGSFLTQENELSQVDLL
jgi:hypothetical protein